MAIYARGTGAHDAERVQPEPGSDEEKRLQALADDPVSGWRRVDEPEPEPVAPSRPAKSAPKGDWVAWAVANGAEQAEAEKATKDDLIAAYGQDEPDPDGGEGS
ncbi:hypothetical protein [Actinomadura montaniterrae]|uniref:Uncharacterized protein n=1 Tax=Actinomadura montaniterrae TaxID=1803903 RepID=A0A6L3W2G9_9ACTN|nr:hypothetical protein [Actinomadura montaniterrae]KAB2384753.1 hypothetical protein F9B16_09910 [Actinomadura montaniterrae]